MSSAITSLVSIRYQWVKISGLDRLLGGLADNKNASLSGLLVLPATRYDTSDSAFVEVAFSCPGLELEGVVFVPKSEVIAIVKTSNPEDLFKVGYTGRSVGERLDPIPLPDAPESTVAI